MLTPWWIPWWWQASVIPWHCHNNRYFRLRVLVCPAILRDQGVQGRHSREELYPDQSFVRSTPSRVLSVEMQQQRLTLWHGDSTDGSGVATGSRPTGLLMPNTECQPKVRSEDQLYRYNGGVWLVWHNIIHIVITSSLSLTSHHWSQINKNNFFSSKLFI